MEIQIPDLAKHQIGKYIDQVAELEQNKKAAMLLYIDPITEMIETIKQKIIVEWRLTPAERKFFGTAGGPFETAHATVTQSTKSTIDYEAVARDTLKVDAKASSGDMASAMGLTKEDFLAKYAKSSVGKASVRIYS